MEGSALNTVMQGCLNLFKQIEAGKQPNNMFGCSYTWTQPRIYHEFIFQLLQYRIMITACEEALISVLHGHKRKHRLSVRLDNKAVFAAAWNDWSVSLATNDVTPLLTTS